MKSDKVTALEERIGYKFRNSELLVEALTHPSVGHETKRKHFDNQRLEFLGDAVLQLAITERLYRHFGEQDEGCLTQLRSRLVSREILKTYAMAIDLGRHLVMGRGEEASGGRARASTLADAFESLIGAIYLDSDLETARKFVLAQSQEEFDRIAAEPVDINPKGDLQELLQSISPVSPVYQTISESGPEHEKTFLVKAIWEGMVLGQGRGHSKKQAETAAAEEALSLKRWENQERLAKDSKKKNPKGASRSRPAESV